MNPEQIYAVLMADRTGHIETIPVHADTPEVASQTAYQSRQDADMVAITSLAELQAGKSLMDDLVGQDGVQIQNAHRWLATALTPEQETALCPIEAEERQDAMVRASVGAPGLVIGAVSYEEVVGLMSFLSGFEQELQGQAL